MSGSFIGGPASVFLGWRNSMSNPGPGAGDIFDVKKVRRLVELMKEHDLAEIDLRQGEQRIRLRRGGEPQIIAGGQYVSPMTGGHGPTNPPTTTPPTVDDKSLQIIKSPMVGTFYAAGNPESPAFVKV